MAQSTPPAAIDGSRQANTAGGSAGPPPPQVVKEAMGQGTACAAACSRGSTSKDARSREHQGGQRWGRVIVLCVRVCAYCGHEQEVLSELQT